MRPGPIEEFGDDPRAEPAGSTDPFGLQVVEPGHELRFVGVLRGRRAVIVVAVPGQQ